MGGLAYQNKFECEERLGATTPIGSKPERSLAKPNRAESACPYWCVSEPGSPALAILAGSILSLPFLASITFALSQRKL